MQIEVKQKNLPISIKKAQLLGSNLKGKKINEALNILKFSNKKTAYYLKKLLENGIAAASDKNLDEKKLYLKSLRIDRAPYLKRVQYRARGRADLIRKPRSHFRIVLAELEEPVKTKPKAQTNKTLKEKENGTKS